MIRCTHTVGTCLVFKDEPVRTRVKDLLQGLFVRAHEDLSNVEHVKLGVVKVHCDVWCNSTSSHKALDQVVSPLEELEGLRPLIDKSVNYGTLII